MQILHWQALSAVARQQALARPAQQHADAVQAQVRAIVADVRQRGDAALLELTQRFDKVSLASVQVSEEEIRAAGLQLSAAEHAAIDVAIAHVRAFHAAQRPADVRIDTAPGVRCERMQRPIAAVGLYVPAGSAPLPSTAIMLTVPAVLAGCAQRIVCTPPNGSGAADAAVVVAAHKAGATRIFKAGGAQAVAALAYGTASIPKCDKIFGPGNAWVTAAKQAVAQDAGGAAFDLPAGPSEVLVIADAAAEAAFIAADLLAQAEHSPDAQALLVTVSAAQAQEVGRQISRQVKELSRREILAASVANIRLIVTATLEDAFAVSNEYAPEHLIVQVRDARSWLPRIEHAGAVFLGDWSPESVGDYCSGPNHTLPTYGFARAYSGLGLEDFQKRITVQELTRDGLRGLAPATETLAAMEGLDAHARAVSLRLASARA
jgi:histidinol dehydrogenase